MKRDKNYDLLRVVSCTTVLCFVMLSGAFLFNDMQC